MRKGGDGDVFAVVRSVGEEGSVSWIGRWASEEEGDRREREAMPAKERARSKERAKETKSKEIAKE